MQCGGRKKFLEVSICSLMNHRCDAPFNYPSFMNPFGKRPKQTFEALLWQKDKTMLQKVES
jgi:hypothetical protein